MHAVAKKLEICLYLVCKMSYVPLKSENCMQNEEKNQNFIVAIFFMKMGRNAKISSSAL